MSAELSLAPEILSSVERALLEDIGPGDETTDGIVPMGASLAAKIIAKEPGIVAGIQLARAAFTIKNGQIVFEPLVMDGEPVGATQTLAEIKGSARAILTAERTALNFLGRMSGIATQTRRFVD